MCNCIHRVYCLLVFSLQCMYNFGHFVSFCHEWIVTDREMRMRKRRRTMQTQNDFGIVETESKWVNLIRCEPDKYLTTFTICSTVKIYVAIRTHSIHTIPIYLDTHTTYLPTYLYNMYTYSVPVQVYIVQFVHKYILHRLLLFHSRLFHTILINNCSLVLMKLRHLPSDHIEKSKEF